MSNDMKCTGIAECVHCEDELLFYLEVANPPQHIQDEARRIDGEDYMPSCFGTCVKYALYEKTFELSPDMQGTDIYYEPNEGNRVWFAAGATEEFMKEAISLCEASLEAELSKLNQKPEQGQNLTMGGM